MNLNLNLDFINKIIIISLFVFVSCKNTETYRMAEDYLKHDSNIISKVGTDSIQLGGVVWTHVCPNDIDNQYGGAFALYDILVKDNKGEYISAYVFLKKRDEKWMHDTILYNPDKETIIKIHKKYDMK